MLEYDLELMECRSCSTGCAENDFMSSPSKQLLAGINTSLKLRVLAGNSARKQSEENNIMFDSLMHVRAAFCSVFKNVWWSACWLWLCHGLRFVLFGICLGKVAMYVPKIILAGKDICMHARCRC